MVALILVLVIPVCILLGALPMPLLSRRTFRRTKGLFRCKASVESGVVPWLGRHRGRRWWRGAWAHDVLILQRGWFFGSLRHVPVRSAEGVRPDKDDMVTVRLRIDDGPVIALWCKEADLSKVVGPFLMAELEHLARADS